MRLICDEEQNYYPIKRITEKRHNQQGVKLGTTWIKKENNKSEKVATARMKVLGKEGKGKLRATEQVGFEIETPDNQKRKMYVINEVMDKKKEQRTNYGSK